MASPKEECFEKATRRFEEATGQDLGVEFEQGWRLMNDGTWEQGSSFFSALNSFLRGNAVQVRRPDLTINGNTVVDLKFTRPSGGTDDWATRPGASGSMQRDDYNAINEQHNPDFAAENDDPKLDPTTCQCDGRGSDGVGVEVPEQEMGPLGLGPAIPRGAPGTSGAQAPVRTPVPIRVPSSRAYKTDIERADLGAERLLSLDVKTYRWRSDGAPDLGLIAEEVRDAVPELYHADGDFAGIKAAQLPFYLLEIIKAQQARLEALEERIKALDGRGHDTKDDR